MDRKSDPLVIFSPEKELCDRQLGRIGLNRIDFWTKKFGTCNIDKFEFAKIIS